MITKQVTIDYLVDEQTLIGALGGKYVQFAPAPEAVEGAEPVPEAAPVDIAACAAADVYLEKAVRVPDEFVEVRECVQKRIGALQAIL